MPELPEVETVARDLRPLITGATIVDATTLTEALALAGGPARGANLGSVVLFRRAPGEQLETKQINVRHMYAKRDLSEDVLLRPGDILFVPRGVLGKLQPMLDLLRFPVY